MTLSADLRAAKALIDTPEKFNAMGKSYSAALFWACAEWRRFMEAEQALAAIRLRGHGHRSLMDRFDRAIAEAESEVK